MTQGWVVVETEAVVEDELDIVQKLLHPVVVVRVQTLLHSTQVHWLRDDLVVVRRIVSLWVHWLLEVFRILALL